MIRLVLVQVATTCVPVKVCHTFKDIDLYIIEITMHTQIHCVMDCLRRESKVQC